MARHDASRLGLLAGAGLGLLLLAGCSQPQVQTLVVAPGPVERPDMVLVHNFAVHPQQVRLDSGLRGRLTQVFSGETATQQQYEAALASSSALAQAVAEELRRTGLQVERVPTPDPPGIGRYLLVDGQLLGVDEGNRTRRTLIGLGSGKSSVEVAAQLFLIQRGTPPRLLESFTAEADSGSMPGMLETGAAGAVAGRLASSAAIGAAGQTVLEGSRALDTGEAARIGRALAERLTQYFAQQGWIASPR
jgi:Domain of unknown function (DUF4410)